MTRRLTFGVGAVLLLVGIVALTSHASVWAPTRTGVADSAELVTIVLAAFALTFTVGMAWMRLDAFGGQVPIRAAAPGAVVVAVVLSLVAITQVDLHPAAPAPGVEAPDPDSGRPGIRLRSDWRGPAVRRGGDDAGAEGLGSVVSDRARFVRRVLLFVGVLGMALLVSLRRPGRRPAAVGLPETQGDQVRVETHGAIVSAIDAMLGDPDPRTAIIGAYARLLEELETIGAAKWDYEGPTEHLRRILERLDVRPVALETLIRLFEIARFSEHTLTSRHREEALTALQDVGADLAEPSSQPRTSVGLEATELV